MSCGGGAGGARAAKIDLSTQAIVQGTVVRDGEPVIGAYVRLLDRSREFTAEVPTGPSGDFRFFAAPGEWTVRVLAPRSEPVESPVRAAQGLVSEVELTLV